MDPVSSAASVITLIDVAIKTFKAIRKITQGYKNAPAEITDLGHRIQGWKSHLVLLRQVLESVSDGGDVLKLDSIELVQLKESVTTSVAIFAEILIFLEKQSSKIGRSAHLMWALGDASKAKAWEDRLRRHGEILQMTLLLLESRYSSLLHAEFKAFKESSKLPTPQTTRTLSTDATRFAWARSRFGSDWEIPYVAKVDGSIHCSKSSEHLSYGVSIRLRALFSLKVFCVEMRLKQQSLFSVEVSARSSGVVLKNVVSDNSMIMVACESGDDSTVWNLMIEGKASVNDITPDNFSPLSYAIAGGSLDILSFLVSRGADTRKTFGRFQTGPLEWAFSYRQIQVARWLLDHGADVHHIGVRGWTPVFSLFGDEPCHQTPCEDFLELLSAASFEDFNAQDAAGWSGMHRAAAYGTSDHIRSLVARGATLTSRLSNTGWTPIFCAVQNNNLSTFAEIIQHEPWLLTVTDRRNWTLLHVAVNAQALDVMRYLIELGVDPHVLSYPTALFISKDLKGLSLTSADIARARGPLVLSAYLEALQVKGYEIRVVDNEVEDSFDLFWPALESTGQLPS